jgi:hypothetical protein
MIDGRRKLNGIVCARNAIGGKPLGIYYGSWLVRLLGCLCGVGLAGDQQQASTAPDLKRVWTRKLSCLNECCSVKVLQVAECTGQEILRTPLPPRMLTLMVRPDLSRMLCLVLCRTGFGTRYHFGFSYLLALRPYNPNTIDEI